MKLGLLCASAGLEFPRGAEEEEIEILESYSGKVTSGAMFLNVRGRTGNGQAHIEEAVRRGAKWIVTERGIQPPEGVNILYTEDSRKVVANLYHAFYGFPNEKLCLIGVTGTNGKTTVSRLIYEILRHAGLSCGVIGTLGAELNGETLESVADEPLANMTTPDPKQLYALLSKMAENGAKYVVMEVSSHAMTLGRVSALQFAVGVFTNLTPEHLDFHLTMEDYAKAKASFFHQCKVAVLNADSPYAENMAKNCQGKILTCSGKGEAMEMAVFPRQNSDSVSYIWHDTEGELPVVCHIPGDFTVMNSLQAAVTAMQLDIPKPVILESLQETGGVKGRMEKVRLPDNAGFRVLIDYAHTPDALENLLKSAKKIPHEGDILLLFGCGGDRDRTKRPQMGKIAENYADRIFLTSDNSRSEEPMEIIKEILGGMQGGKVRIIPNRTLAIREAVLGAKRGDILLLAGKGHEEYEIVGNEKRRFCEREIVLEAYSMRKEGKNEN